jgi:hypothetical protein
MTRKPPRKVIDMGDAEGMELHDTLSLERMAEIADEIRAERRAKYKEWALANVPGAKVTRGPDGREILYLGRIAEDDPTVRDNVFLAPGESLDDLDEGALEKARARVATVKQWVELEPGVPGVYVGMSAEGTLHIKVDDEVARGLLDDVAQRDDGAPMTIESVLNDLRARSPQDAISDRAARSIIRDREMQFQREYDFDRWYLAQLRERLRKAEEEDIPWGSKAKRDAERAAEQKREDDYFAERAKLRAEKERKKH